MKIYICDIEKTKIADQYDSIITRLDEARQKEITRFRQKAGRLTALVREILFCAAMHETFEDKIPIIDRNKYGKPFVSKLKNPDGSSCGKQEYQGFDFNFTHSGNLVAIAFDNDSIGIDLEPYDRIKDYKKLLRFFTASEQSQILNANSPQKEFFRVWTYREAFSKAEGTGLTLFEKHPMDIDYENKNVLFYDKIFYFYEFFINTLNHFDSDIFTDYQISVCTNRKSLPTAPTIINDELWNSMLEIFYKRSSSIAYK